jgi:hypothetical protein
MDDEIHQRRFKDNAKLVTSKENSSNTNKDN